MKKKNGQDYCDEASHFARCLLMPEKMVLKEWRRANAAYSGSTRIGYMADVFGLTVKETAQRLYELDLIPKQ